MKDAGEGAFELARVRFSHEGIERGTGAEQQWKIRRASVRSMRVYDATAAESPLRQFFWGGMLLFISFIGLHDIRHWASIPASLLFLGLGLFTLRHVFRRFTYLEIVNDRAAASLSLERRLSDPEKSELREKLRALGFPLVP